MERIGKYIILEGLGKGGMGKVYKAHDPIIGRDVAVKVIHDHVLDVPEVKERFYREARAVGQLSHENITVIHDIGEEDGRPFIVMELLSGTDLRKRMDMPKSFTLAQKLDVAIQAAEGLCYAHRRGVVHRDIKPDNIRILEDGRVKIMDFGIAHLGVETVTLTRHSIGTPRYMAPEQIKEEGIDRRTDVFSFGVVLYEMLAGASPFSGTHVTALIYSILHEEPKPFRIEGTPLSEDLQRVVLRCLAKDPGKRYPSFEEVLRDLRAIAARQQAANEASLPPPPHAASASSSSAKALWRVLGAVLVAGLVAGAYFLFYDQGESEAITDTDTEEVDTAEVTEEADTAEVTDVVGEDPNPNKELEALRADASKQQEQMRQTKRRAEQAGASTQAQSLFERAQGRERDGDLAMERGGDVGLREARQAFAEADQMYAEAIQNVLRQEAEQDQQAVLGAQQAMMGARRAVLEAQQAMTGARRAVEERSDSFDVTGDSQWAEALRAAGEEQAGAQDLYQRAEALRAAGEEEYGAQDLEAAARTFGEARTSYEKAHASYKEAQTSYEEVQQTLETLAQNRNRADAARAAMRTAQEKAEAAGPASRQQSQYERALALERQGEEEYEASAFDQAAERFKQAEALFDEAASAAEPLEQVKQAVDALTQELKRNFEREDLARLQNMSSFYGGWSGFFEVAHDITVDVQASDLNVTGSRATVNLDIRLRYKNNKNQTQEENLEHAWVLERSGAGWVIRQVSTK